jgi:hypothetical protein
VIRRADRLWIASKKLTVRKRWVAFTLFSLSLGLVVFTATTSLAEGVRAAFFNTVLLAVRKFPADSIRVDHRNPRIARIVPPREVYIRDEEMKKISGLSGVEAVTERVVVSPIRIGLAIETMDGANTVHGMADEFLARFLPPGRRLWEDPGRVPLIVNRTMLASRYDAAAQRFRVVSDLPLARELGRDVDLWIGYNGAVEGEFKEEYDEGRRKILRCSRDEVELRRAQHYRYLAARFDMNIYQRALRLRARVVGIADIETSLIPLSVARSAATWLRCREQLASRTGTGSSRPDADGDEPRGRANDRGHQSVWVLVERDRPLAPVMAAIRVLGFHPVSRDSMVSEAMEEFASAVKVVRAIFYGIGLAIFALASLFVWTTMSKVIGDSRREIGVFRAVGATRRDILSIFVLQALMLGVAGSLIGVALGFGIARMVSRAVLVHVRHQDLFWPLEGYGLEAEDVLPPALYAVDPLATAAMIAGAVVASVAAGLVPAWRAANMDPVAALQRRE